MHDVVRRVLASRSAKSAPALRRAVFDYVAAVTRGEAVPALSPELASYMRKVALHAYKVVDNDVDALRAAGYSVEDVFELTVTAAVSAGATRLELALSALERANGAD